MLDGFGAEAFFRLIDLSWAGKLEEVAGKIGQSEPAHLDHWMGRFRPGRK